MRLARQHLASALGAPQLVRNAECRYSACWPAVPRVKDFDATAHADLPRHGRRALVRDARRRRRFPDHPAGDRQDADGEAGRSVHVDGLQGAPGGLPRRAPPRLRRLGPRAARRRGPQPRRVACVRRPRGRADPRGQGPARHRGRLSHERRGTQRAHDLPPHDGHADEAHGRAAAAAGARRRQAGPGARSRRPRRHARARPRLGRRRRRRRDRPRQGRRLRPALLGADLRPHEVLRDRARRGPPLHDPRRCRRLGATDGPHDLPHLRGGPGRAEGARRRQPRPRAQGRLRDVLPGPRDLRRRDLQGRRGARRASHVLPHGRPPRARVAGDGGRDGVRPHARAGSERQPHRGPAREGARRHPAARQPRRLRLLAHRV